jgi:hypothetical protein
VALKGQSYTKTCSVETSSTKPQLFTPSRLGGHLSIMKRTKRTQKHLTDPSSTIQLRQAHATLSASLDNPKGKFTDHSDYLFPICTLSPGSVPDRTLRSRNQQPPDRPVDARAKPATLDPAEEYWTKMVRRTRAHGGVRDQKKKGNAKGEGPAPFTPFREQARYTFAWMADHVNNQERLCCGCAPTICKIIQR